jgi:hypothetical protein
MSNRRYTFIGLMNSIVNIITDVLFTVIPVPVVLKLKVNKRTKATLIAVLSLGFVACVAGIIKAHSQVTAMATPDAAFENSFQIWYMLELCLGLVPSGPTTFPGPRDGIRLGHCKKGSNSTSATLVQKTSDTDLGDGDAVKAPYDVRVTGGTATEDGDQWDSVETVRCGSQDRLHHPKSGIFKKVELSHTTEVIK